MVMNKFDFSDEQDTHRLVKAANEKEAEDWAKRLGATSDFHHESYFFVETNVGFVPNDPALCELTDELDPELDIAADHHFVFERVQFLSAELANQLAHLINVGEFEKNGLTDAMVRSVVWRSAADEAAAWQQ